MDDLTSNSFRPIDQAYMSRSASGLTWLTSSEVLYNIQPACIHLIITINDRLIGTTESLKAMRSIMLEGNFGFS